MPPRGDGEDPPGARIRQDEGLVAVAAKLGYHSEEVGAAPASPERRSERVEADGPGDYESHVLGSRRKDQED